MRSISSTWKTYILILLFIWIVLPYSAQLQAQRYPLKMSENRRYLIDQDGHPFLIRGDSPHSLIVNLTYTDADFYFSTISGYGINSVWIELVCNDYCGGRKDASTYNGVYPFTRTGDLTSPNETYFLRADSMIRIAARYNICVFLDPCETGGFLDIMKKNAPSGCTMNGEYLGNRYKDFDNIVWLSGNDFQTWKTDNAADSAVSSVARGILKYDKRHIHTVELDYNTSGSLDDRSWGPIICLCASYTYFPTYSQVLGDYNRAAGKMPVFMIEANYEFEHNTGPMTRLKTLRMEEYWSMTSGACGQLYGNGYTWRFRPAGDTSLWADWKSHLQTPGLLQMKYNGLFFGLEKWYELIPDQNHNILVSGYGTFNNNNVDIIKNDYATAAYTLDGTLAIIYIPSARTVTVNLGKLKGQVSAQWYDPAGNTFVTVKGSPFANRNKHDFVTPGKNSDGDEDFVLLLKTAERRK
jgi:hypothetical protein